MSDGLKVHFMTDDYDTMEDDLRIHLLPKSLQTIKLVQSSIGDAKVTVDTAEGWALRPTYIPKNGEIAVYSNATVLDKNYPAIKVGDGNAYVVDLPFLGEEKTNVLFEHIANDEIHVTPEEKTFWNAKLNYDIAGEQLILTTN